MSMNDSTNWLNNFHQNLQVFLNELNGASSREIAIVNENNYENKVENKVIDKSLVIIVFAYL